VVPIAAGSEANPIASTSASTSNAIPIYSSIVVTEIELAMDALSKRVRSSTAMNYRMPLEHWKVIFISSL